MRLLGMLVGVGMVVGCGGSSSGGDGTGTPPNMRGNSSARGEGASLEEFVDEFWDPSACDSFRPCGDVVTGRFQYKSAKICSESGLAGLSEAEDGFDEMCSSGVNAYMDFDIEMQIDIVGQRCSGHAQADATFVMEMTAACIREAGGGSLRTACPELDEGLRQSADPQMTEGTECTVIGDVCSCTMKMGEFIRGDCEDFVLDSACLDGDTLRFSNAETSAEPVVWTFTRSGSAAGTSSDEQALTGEDAAPLVRAAAAGSGQPKRLLSSVRNLPVLSERARQWMSMAARRWRGGP